MESAQLTQQNAQYDKTILNLLFVSWAVCFIYAFFTNTWLEALLIGAVIVALPAFYVYQAPGKKINGHILAIAHSLIVMLQVQQSGGDVNSHFMFFVNASFFFIYRRWTIFRTIFIIVAVHHVGFYLIQVTSNFNLYLFNNANLYLSTLVIHALFWLAECGILGWMAFKSTEEREMVMMVSQITADPEKLNFTIQSNNNGIVINQFNQLLSSTQEALGCADMTCVKVNNISQKVNTDVEQIKMASSVQLEETSLIATAIEEISVTLEDMSQSAELAFNKVQQAVTQNSDASEQVQKSSVAISELEKVIQETSTSIGALAENTTQIGQVLDVINNIAEQTNLLALNAAIEAARAGEHGRGFAVVADEVRTLASRTRDSIDEIHQIISALQGASENSVQAMNKCTTYIAQTHQNAEQASDIIQSSTAAINDLSVLNESVVTAITQQTTVTQTVAANSSNIKQQLESSVANIDNVVETMQNLVKESNQLSNNMSKFVVKA